VPVCIVGDGADAAELSPRAPVRADVKFSDGNAGVSLKGPQSEAELRLLYSRAAIYAGTCRYDPSGMAVLEAALSRCALILNDVPSQRELWGPAAVYFRTNESESLAEAVRILTADVQLRRNFANRAFQRLQEKLSALPAPEFGTMTAREFFLYQSQLSPKGSKYTKLERFALK